MPGTKCWIFLYEAKIYFFSVNEGILNTFKGRDNEKLPVYRI